VPTPGWYADPHAPGQLRWWDGGAWTAHTMPAATTPAPRSSNRSALVIGGIAVCGLLLLAVVIVIALAGSTASRSQAHGSDLGTGGPADRTPLSTRASQAGIPLLGTEGSATHTHTLLHITLDGKPVSVPAAIGIDGTSGRIAAVHTHASTGVIHVESPDIDDTYRLAQFLTLWGVGGDEASICQHLAGGACQITVSVVDPTDADQHTFEGFGPMPDRADTPARGLDTELAQGAVIVVALTTAAQT